MVYLSRILVAIILSVCLREIACQNVPNSPCPEVLKYIQNSENVSNRYYATITIPTPEENQWTVFNISIGGNGRVYDNKRALQLTTTKDETANEAQKGMKIEYVLLLPYGDEIPVVKYVYLNGQLICKGSNKYFQNNWSFESFFLFGRNVVQVEHIANTEEILFNSQTPIQMSQIPSNPSKGYKPYPSVFYQNNFFFGQKETKELQQNSSQNKQESRMALPEAPKITMETTTIPNKPSNGAWLRDLPFACGRRLMHSNNLTGTPTIYNGKIFSKGEFPWLVLVYLNKGKHFCGGSLVSDRYVITAGHCVSNNTVEFLEFGRYDKYAIEDSVERRAPRSIILHHTYSDNEVRGDIALISFDPVTFTQMVIPICIWPFGKKFDKVDELNYGVVAGWGLVEDGYAQNLPRKTNVDIVDLKECRDSSKHLRDIAKEQTFCAGGKRTGPCHGDSGGGFYLIHNGVRYLRGIISHSIVDKRDLNICLTDFYAVYVDISYYLDWLKPYLLM